MGPQLRWSAGLRTILVDLAGVSSARPFASPAMLQLSLDGTSHVAQSDSQRGLPSVAPAIERVYRNCQHLGQVSDRHESLAHIESHDHLRSIRNQYGHSGWCRSQLTACQAAIDGG